MFCTICEVSDGGIAKENGNMDDGKKKVTVNVRDVAPSGPECHRVANYATSQSSLLQRMERQMTPCERKIKDEVEGRDDSIVGEK